MAQLYPLLHLVFPKTPPYRLKGRLKHEGNVWSFANFSGRVGGSDLSGNIRVDTAPKRAFMKADLVSNLLDFDDLAGFIGGKPGTTPGKAASEKQKIASCQSKRPVIEYFLIKLTILNVCGAMDADVHCAPKKFSRPSCPSTTLTQR